MAQEGIDALAELWEETGTFRKTGGKNVMDGMETLTLAIQSQSSLIGVWPT